MHDSNRFTLRIATDSEYTFSIIVNAVSRHLLDVYPRVPLHMLRINALVYDAQNDDCMPNLMFHVSTDSVHWPRPAAQRTH
jgi:hypothetical protein